MNIFMHIKSSFMLGRRGALELEQHQLYSNNYERSLKCLKDSWLQPIISSTSLMNKVSFSSLSKKGGSEEKNMVFCADIIMHTRASLRCFLATTKMLLILMVSIASHLLASSTSSRTYTFNTSVSLGNSLTSRRSKIIPTINLKSLSGKKPTLRHLCQSMSL